MRKIRWFITNLFNYILGYCLSIFIEKNNRYIMLCCRYGNTDSFLHNTKYMFLYLNSINTGYQCFWLCDDEKQIEIFKKYGYKNVFKRNSFKGIYYSLKSKYWLHNYLTIDLPCIFLHGATIINLWHGIPLKKICYDTNDLKSSIFKQIIIKTLILQNDYFNVNNVYESSCYQTAFLTTDDKIKILGSPRLDVLLNDIPNADLFMEKDFDAIKKLKEQGKKIFIYMPTFRETGKDISGWLKSEKLKLFLQKNNIILVCKLHPFDKNSLNFKLTENFYKMDNDSDVYPILKYTDCLITDYSSVYFDYLLLDKPVIYYPIDLEEYQEKCRGFYEPYENLIAGIKAYNEQELISAMQDVINGIDNYKEKRKVLRDRMFKYQDGKNCERVIEWIKSLDEKKGK